MKAVIYTEYGGPEVLKLVDEPKPVPGKNEILVRLAATAITTGDTELRSPKIPDLTWFIVRLFFGLRKPKLRILGGYIAGVVESVGSGISGFKKGDRVVTINGTKFGGYAEYVNVHKKEVMSIVPDGVNFEEVVPVGLGLDSLNFINMTKVKSGDRILINGAGGGIGGYAIQIASGKGAIVTAVDRTVKHEMMIELGATEVIDFQKDELSKGGYKYEAIFDVVGTISHGDSLKLLKKGGRYITAIPSLLRIFKSFWLSVLSRLPGPHNGKKVKTGLTSPKREDFDYLVDLIRQKKLKTWIERTYALEEVRMAHEHIETGNKVGNTVLKLDLTT